MRFLVLFLLSLPVFAQDYYIANSGDNTNPGTRPSPWATLMHAYNNIEAGDTVNLKRGDTWKSYIQTVNGVTYQSYGEGELPLVDGDQKDWYGVWGIAAQDITIRDIEFTNSKSTGIWLYSEPGVPVKNIILEGLYIHDVPISAAMWIYNGNQQQDAIDNIDNNVWMENIIVRNNLIERVGQSGVLIAGVKNAFIYGNRIHRSGEQRTPNNAISLHACEDVSVVNNHVTDTMTGSTSGDGHGVNLDRLGEDYDYNCKRVLVKSNVVSNIINNGNFSAGIQSWRGQDSIIEDNYVGGTDAGYVNSAEGSTGNIFRNNVSVNTKIGFRADVRSGQAEVYGNTFHGTLAAFHTMWPGEYPLEHDNYLCGFEYTHIGHGDNPGPPLHETDVICP